MLYVYIHIYIYYSERESYTTEINKYITVKSKDIVLTQTEPKKQSLTLEQSFAGYVRQALILKPTEGNDKTSRNSNWGLGLVSLVVRV